MLETTKNAVKSILLTDTSLSPDDRSGMLSALVAYGRGDSNKGEKVPRLLRRKEVAARLGVSHRTVDKLHSEGLIKKFFFKGRKRASGFLESDINAILLANGKGGENEG